MQWLPKIGKEISFCKALMKHYEQFVPIPYPGVPGTERGRHF